MPRRSSSSQNSADLRVEVWLGTMWRVERDLWCAGLGQSYMGHYAAGIVVRQQPAVERLSQLPAYIADWQVYEWAGKGLWRVDVKIGRGFPTRLPAAIGRQSARLFEKVKFGDVHDLVVVFDLAECLQQAVLGFRAPDEAPESVFVCEPGKVLLAYREPWTFQHKRMRKGSPATVMSQASVNAVNDFAGRDVAEPDDVVPEGPALTLIARRGPRGVVKLIEASAPRGRSEVLRLRYEFALQGFGFGVVGWSPDGQYLLTTDFTHTHIRDATTGRIRLELDGHGIAAWEPDSSALALLVKPSGPGPRAMLQWWNTRTGKLEQTAVLSERESNFTALAWAPDGFHLVAGGQYVGGLWFIHADTGKVDRTISPQSQFACLAWSPDGRFLATAARKKLTLFDRSGKKLWRVEGQPERIDSLAWSLDGTTLASPAGAKVRLAHAKTGKSFAELVAEPEKMVDIRTQGILSVSYSADGRFLAACTAEHGYLWLTAQRELIASFDARCRLAFHPREPLLAISDKDNKVRVLEIVH